VEEGNRFSEVGEAASTCGSRQPPRARRGEGGRGTRSRAFTSDVGETFCRLYPACGIACANATRDEHLCEWLVLIDVVI
jgi:hypothetical protein